MSEVQLKNKNILQTLDNLVEDFFSKPDYNNSKYGVNSKNWNTQSNPEYWCSEHYLKELLKKPLDHNGEPEEYAAQPISNMEKIDPDIWTPFRKKARIDFTLEIGATHAALTNYYPPGGFVGWHTNWNASAHQILFTWSKTGEGYFRYYDNQTKEIITIDDVPGWQCRYYYFGRKEEPNYWCWHSAYTYCERITLAYKFQNTNIYHSDNALAESIRDDLIEELEHEK